MFEVHPYPDEWEAAADGSAPAHPGSVGVVVPTRDRPDRLARCLDSLEAARELQSFEIVVCDSSGPELDESVKEICEFRPDTRLVRHDRIGAAAARNVGTLASNAELLVAVDDDVYVEPNAIAELVAAHREPGGATVVAGEVRWSHWTSKPLRMRRIGFGEEAIPGEEVEFLVSALILYPRRLALELPWNERLWPYDDRFATMIWRAAGATLGHAPEARAAHDQRQSSYRVSHHADRIYANLTDALLIQRSPLRLAEFELLSFAACVKESWPSPGRLWGLCRAWMRGHRRFARDRRALRGQVRRAFEAVEGEWGR